MSQEQFSYCQTGACWDAWGVERAHAPPQWMQPPPCPPSHALGTPNQTRVLLAPLCYFLALPWVSCAPVPVSLAVPCTKQHSQPWAHAPGVKHQRVVPTGQRHGIPVALGSAAAWTTCQHEGSLHEAVCRSGIWPKQKGNRLRLRCQFCAQRGERGTVFGQAWSVTMWMTETMTAASPGSA